MKTSNVFSEQTTVCLINSYFEYLNCKPCRIISIIYSLKNIVLLEQNDKKYF